MSKPPAFRPPETWLEALARIDKLERENHRMHELLERRTKCAGGCGARLAIFVCPRCRRVQSRKGKS